MSTEIAFYYAGDWGSGQWLRLFSKTASGTEFTAFIDVTTNYIGIQRSTTGGGVDRYEAQTTGISSGNWYEVQIMWKCGCGPSSPPYSKPIIIINNVSQYVAHTQTGAGDWVFDGNGTLVVGNRDGSLGLGCCMQGSLAIFRWYDYDASGSFATNYAADSQMWAQIATSLTINYSPTQIVTNENFNINGTLLDVNGAGIPGQTINLQLNESGQWLGAGTATTDASGNYSFTENIDAAGTYTYRTIYSGGSGYAGCTSAEINPVIIGNLYDVDGALVTNCEVEFINTSFPSSGTAITNVGQAPSSNGLAYQNDYTLITTGDAGWAFANNTAEYLNIPSSSNVDNLSNVTLEFLFYWNGASSGGNAPPSYGNVIFSKGGGSGSCYFQVNVDSTTGTLYVGKVCSGSGAGAMWDMWGTSSNSITASTWNFVQITWACGGVGTAVGAEPVVYINNVNKPLTHTIVGIGVWLTDVGSQITLGNYSNGGYQLYGTLALVRIHNAILTSGAGSQLAGNYTASVWRAGITNVSIFVDVPGATTATISPTLHIDAHVPTLTPIASSASTTTLSNMRADAALTVSTVVSNVNASSVIVAPVDAKINVATINSTAAAITVTPGLGHSIVVDVPGAAAAPIPLATFHTAITSNETASLAASSEVGSLSNVTVTITETATIALTESIAPSIEADETTTLSEQEGVSEATEADEADSLTPVEIQALTTNAQAAESVVLAPIETLTNEEHLSTSETNALSVLEESDVGGDTEYVNASEDILLFNLETSSLGAIASASETQVLVPTETIIDEAGITETDTIIPLESQGGAIEQDEVSLITTTSEAATTGQFLSPVILETVSLTPIEKSSTNQTTVVFVSVNEFSAIITRELTVPTIPVLSAEPETLITLEAILPEVVFDYKDVLDTLISSEGITIEALFSGSEGLVENEPLKPIDASTFSATVNINENTNLAPAELSHLILENTIYISHSEVLYLKPLDSTLNEPLIPIQTPAGTAIVDALRVQLTTNDTNSVYSIEVADVNPNIYHAPPPLVDYVLEVRRKNGANYDFLGVLENRVAPELQCEIGTADQLTFNIPLSDPKSLLFNANNISGLEIWYYGRDASLKQVFTITGGGKTEGYRDYGGASGGSGGSTLGTGSGDWLLVTALGPEAYLTMYYIPDYTATQKYVTTILNDICAELLADGYITEIIVDPILNKLIDIDLSWANIQSAVGNIIQQTGGYLRVLVNPNDPTQRTLYLSQEVANDIFPENLGGVLTAQPAACSWGPNRIDVFGRGTDSALWHKAWVGSAWSGWQNLGGGIVGAPTVCSWANNCLDVFARGTDNAIWHKYWNGAWSGWASIGGNVTSSPAACAWRNDALHVFARGTNSQLYHRAYSAGAWQPWESLGGNITSDPACASWGGERIDIFARGTDNALWHIAWTGTKWSPWQSLGGQLNSGPAVASWGENRLDVFAAGTDNALWWTWWAENPVLPSRRVFNSALSQITDSFCQTCVDEGWGGIVIFWDAGQSNSVEELAPYIALIASYGLQVWIEIEEVMNAHFTASTTLEQYTTDTTVPGANGVAWGTIMSNFDADGRIAGFVFEGSYDVGVQFLRTVTTKILTQCWVNAYGSYNSNGVWENLYGPQYGLFNLGGGNATTYRLLNVDELLWETYSPNECASAAAALPYFINNFPNLKVGIIGMVSQTNYWQWWQTYAYIDAHINDVPPPAPIDYATIQSLAQAGFTSIWKSAGFLNVGSTYIDASMTTPLAQQLEFFDGLYFDTWSPWQSLGGQVTTSPAACSWGYGRIDVFLEGPEGAVYHIDYTADTWELTRDDCPKCPKGEKKLEDINTDTDVTALTDPWAAWEALDITPEQPGAAIIKFDVFPSMGNVINNNLGNSSYDGYAFNNNFIELQCGVGSWVFNAPQDVTWTDNIQITSGAEITGLADMTICMCVYIDNNQTALNNPRLFSKQQDTGAFELIYDTYSQCLRLIRYTTNGDYDEWVSEQNSVPIDDWYYIQLVWQSGVSPGTEISPVISVDNEMLTLVNIASGTGEWASDYSNNLFIGNTCRLDGSGDFIGIISYFTLYGSVLLDLEADFNTNAWRRDPADVDAQLVYNFFPPAETPVAPLGVTN